MARRLVSPDQSWPVRFVLGCYEFLASLRFAVVLITLLAVVLGLGTFVESGYGTEAVKFAIWNTWWFTLLNALLAVSIFTAAAIRFPWKRHQTGFVITHIGLLVLLAGCLVSQRGGIDAQIPLLEGDRGRKAYEDSHSFHLRVSPPGDNKAAFTTIGPIPFRSGPFNWNEYTRLMSRSNESAAGSASGGGPRRSIFPWNLAPRDEGLLFDENGIRLEVLDFYADSTVVLAPSVRLEIGSDSFAPPGGQQQGMWTPVELTHDPNPLASRSRRHRTRVGGGEVVFWKVRSKAEREAFLKGIPDPELGFGKQGQLVLVADGVVERVLVDEAIATGPKRIEGTDVRYELVDFQPKLSAVRLRVGRGEASPEEEMVLVAEMPEVSVQARTAGVYGGLWIEPVVADAASRMLGGSKSRIDIIQGETSRAGIAKVYYRCWQPPRITAGELPTDGRGVPVFRMPMATLEMRVERFLPARDLKLVTLPLPFDKKKPPSAKRRAARVRLSVDGTSETFWVSGMPIQPIEEPPGSAERRVVRGSRRQVAVTLEPDAVDIGFDVQLDNFERRLDPGTSQASHFSSVVEFLDGGGEPLVGRPVTITMNAPVDFSDPENGRSYRLFQESFMGPWLPGDPLYEQFTAELAQQGVPPPERLEASVLTVNYDPGRGIKYAGSLLIVAGIFTMFYMKAYFFGPRSRQRDQTGKTARPMAAVAAWLAVACLAAAPAVAGEPDDPLAAWRAIPVLDDGRLMPLDTFARRRVETITNSQEPRLAGPESEEPARRDAGGLLLAWLVDPEAWEDVPILIAEHEEVRGILGLPIFEETAEGRRRLKYASPSDVDGSASLRDRLMEIDRRRRQAAAEGGEFRLEGVDAKVDRLWRAYVTFRRLTYSAESAMGRSRFASLFERLVDRWRPLRSQLEAAGVDATDIQEGLQAILDGMGESTRFPVNAVLPAVLAVRARADELATKLEADGLPSRLVAAARRFAERATVLGEAVFDEGGSPAVVPALHAGALETERDAAEDLPPWLGLRVVLDAPPELLAGYPENLLAEVRKRFASLAGTLGSESFDPAIAGDFAAALRSLGEAIEPIRRELPLERLDADLLEWTAYPPPGSTDREVAYNDQDPFLYSWVLSLLAMAAFAVAVGRVRGAMFWTGVSLLVAELVWTATAFASRIAITGWAPVTNMYETVIYVPFFLSLLGLFFLLAPISARGAAAAWRLTALPPPAGAVIPGEAGGSAAGWILLLPRLAISAGVLWILAMAPYAAGGRTIINLLPQTDIDSSVPSANNLVVWLVGLSVLVPTVWFLPRLVISAVLSLATIPRSWADGQLVAHLEEVYARRSFGLVVTAVAFAGTFIAWFFPIPGKQFSPLQPVLRDNFWLTIHVLTIVSSYAAGALAWGLGCLSLCYYAFGRYRQASSGRRPPEATAALAGFIYKAMQVAVLLLAAGTILGGLWADVSWGRFWGWDPKEVWALVSLLAYLVILHGRYAGWIDNFGLAAGSVVGAAVIGMSWYGVNFLLGAGLHSYGFGQGGQTEFFAFLAANLLLLAAAGWRYRLAAGGAGAA